MKKPLFILLLIPFFSIAQTPPLDNTEYIALWDAYYENVAYDWNNAHALSLSNSGNLNQEYYYLSYYLEGLRGMWQSTGNNAYLDEALMLIHSTIDDAVAVGGGYLGWPSSGGIQVPLWDSYYWREVATLIRVMYQSPILLSTSNGIGGTYQDDFNEILAFSEKNIWERYLGTSDNPTSGHAYRSRTHMASHWMRIGMELYLITGKIRYLNLFENIAFRGFPAATNYPGDNLRNQISYDDVVETAYVWSSKWKINDPPEVVQDISHANEIVSAIVEAYEQGYYWTLADVNALVSTYFDLAWNTGTTNKLSFNVDGSGGTQFTNNRASGLAVLARYDATNLLRVETDYMLFDSEANLDFYAPRIIGQAALARKILTDGSAVYPESSGSGEPEPPPLPNNVLRGRRNLTATMQF